jgi:hypothetical protein
MTIIPAHLRRHGGVMKQAVWLGVLCVSLLGGAAAPAGAQISGFMKVDGVDGESTADSARAGDLTTAGSARSSSSLEVSSSRPARTCFCSILLGR